MEENFRNIYKAIQEADALLIGASNGLSISEGYNIFADDHWFQKDFGDFRSRYGIRNILQGLFFQYPTEESKWAFFSRLISRKCYLEQPGPVMEDLYRLVGSKDYFIVTSNGEDHFVPAGFDRDKVFEMEAVSPSPGARMDAEQILTKTRMKFSKWRKLKKTDRSPQNWSPAVPAVEGQLRSIWQTAMHSFRPNSSKRKCKTIRTLLRNIMVKD
mgnify:CR=1 FL=1